MFSENEQDTAYPILNSSKALEGSLKGSNITEEINRLHSLVSSIEAAVVAHREKLSPVLAELPGDDLSTATDKEAYNPIWDTKAGSGLRELGYRLETVRRMVKTMTKETRL